MVRYRNGVSIEELKLLPIQPRDVLIRTQASIACYSLTPFALNTNNYPQPVILNHSGMGVVEEVGAQVKRVQPGDRVIVAGTPECGSVISACKGVRIGARFWLKWICTRLRKWRMGPRCSRCRGWAA